jgi:hypothetical protein
LAAKINECGVETLRPMDNLFPLMKRFLLPLSLPLALLSGGCLSLKTEHEVKPIHVTVDVNVKVDKALDDFFGDLDQKATAPRS